MLRTTPDQIHVFSREELGALELERGDPLGQVSETASTNVEQPVPAPYPSSIRELGSENVTVVAMTTVAEDASLGRSERIISISETGPLKDTLLKNGFTEQQVNLLLATLRNVRQSLNVESGAMLRILFGPARNANILIPYRMSIYDPSPDEGFLEHSATVASGSTSSKTTMDT